MGKRHTATDKWEDDWYMNLPSKYKLFFNYICDKCDSKGIYKPNIPLAEFQIFTPGENGYIDVAEFKKLMTPDRLIEMEGRGWFIKSRVK